MQDIPILVIDDKDVFFEFDDTEQPIVVGLPRQCTPYKFCLEYHGAVQESTAELTGTRSVFDQYVDRIAKLENGNILLLDLGLGTMRLRDSEREEINNSFPDLLSGLDLAGKRDAGLAAGIYLLKKVLDNTQWHGELCIVSSHADANLRVPIIKLLESRGGTTHGARTQVGNVHIRFFGEGIVVTGLDSESDISASVCEKIADAIEFFLIDFDDISWFLHPPALRKVVQDPTEREWFPAGAHDPHEGSDFVLHLNAVLNRFPHWGGIGIEDWAKALVCCSDNARYGVMRNSDGIAGSRQVSAECLKDFFDDLGLEGEGLEWADRIQLPSVPAFPFLIAAKRLVNNIRNADPTLKVVLRKVDEDVLALGVPCLGSWQLCSLLWRELKNETVSENILAEANRIGTTFAAFRDALSARTALPSASSRPRLATVFEGFPNVAIPWITESFMGLSWKTKIDKPLTLGESAKQ